MKNACRNWGLCDAVQSYASDSFFDLPMKTANERKIYAEFRKNLIREGFLMIQESVYVRVATTRESAHFLENRVASFAPAEGLVQSLIITENSTRLFGFSWVDD